MLNRLYIVIGVLAILLLGGGFLIPGMIEWNGYRDRIEALAEDLLGTDVIIAGNIDFELLPQPRMVLGKTIVGPADAPVLEIGGIVAELSLMDFLRDRFMVTKVLVQSPIVNFGLDENGALDIAVDLGERIDAVERASRISIESAEIKDGSFRFSDGRTGKNWDATGFDGELTVSGMNGPFSLLGVGDFGGVEHSLRINVSAINTENKSQLSIFFRPTDGKYSLESNGILSIGSRPQFDGQATFRGQPDTQDIADSARGDFVFSSDVQVTAEKILLSTFIIQPDENRSGTRLTGAADVRLGDSPWFDAVISAGIIGMAPPDLREEADEGPYDLVSLLNDLPLLFVPPISGRVGVDISQLDLRTFSLADVRIDATTNGEVWELADFAGELPGNSKLVLTGTIFDDDGSFGYSGSVSLNSKRLGALAGLWRRAKEGNPLFDHEAALLANVSLAGGVLELSDGQLTLDEQNHDFSARFTLKGDRDALVSARLVALDASQSEAMAALFPDFSTGAAFSASFPKGALDVVAEAATIAGMSGENLAVQMDWDENGLNFDRLAAQDIGGARLALTGSVDGTVANPMINVGGRVTFSSAAATGIIPVLLENVGADAQLTDWLKGSFPIDLNVDLAPPESTGNQQLFIEGRAGETNFTAELQMANGVKDFAGAPMILSAKLNGENADVLTAQFGLGQEALFAPQLPVEVNVRMEGTLSNSVATTIVAQGGEERLGYAGTLILSDISDLRGRGILDVALADMSPFLNMLGVGGLSIGGLEGSADFSFSGAGTLTLSNIVASAMNETGASFGGQLSLTQANGERLANGQLRIGAVDVENLLSLIGGPASLIMAEGQWPDGPIDLGQSARNTRGRVSVDTAGINVGDFKLAEQASFDLVWDANKVGLENIAGSNGDGTISGRVDLCCAIADGDKQFSGRMEVRGILLEGLLPPEIAQTLGGTISGGAQVQATGASVKEMIASLSGEGSFSISDLSIEKFDPGAFGALALVEDIALLDPDALVAIVATALDNGSFNADVLGGVFRVTGGEVKSDNLAAEGGKARLIGGVGVDLSDLSLSGDWTLTPTSLDDPNGLIDESTARITAIVGGSLTDPRRQLDIASMIDAIQVRALEIELARLEILRAEQEARAAEAALARARLMELEAQRLEEEARLLAEEEARLLAEEEAHRLEEEAAAAALEQEAAAALAEEEAAAQAAAAILAEQQQPIIFGSETQDPLVFNPAPIDLFGTPTDLLGGP